jgi:HEAT repeat protein
MVLPELGLGKVIGGAIAKKILDAGISGVAQQLSSSEIEKALDFALSQAQKQVGELVPSLNADGQDRVETFLKGFLGSNICLEELQKPLKLKGSEKPDVAVLAIAFEQAIETTPCIKSVEPEQLERWLRIFVETYFGQTNTFIRYRAKLREYLERLKTSCEDVKFVGIDVSARENHRAARLLEIFVVPNVSEEAKKSALSPERLLLERPEQLTERQAELWMEQRDHHSQKRGRSMSAHEMLGSMRRRVVLLGDPGTGKTTLMRYLAVKAAGTEASDIGLPKDQERLPILVYMRDWAKHPERSLLAQVQDFAENTLQMELPSGFLEHWTDGQALLLLDGLDEVAEDATRATLVEKINCFLADPAHEQNWAVITSRPWGYQPYYFRTDTYPHFELELFNEAQIQEFIEHWYLNRCNNNVAQAQELIRDLQDALKSKDRLQNLVRNPLLLTMVALIHRYQDTLPKRRHKLYDRAVDTLLKSWDRGKWGKTDREAYGEFKYLDRDDDLRRVMSQLAYWIHTQYETQTTESGTVVEEGELLAQLSRIIRDECSSVKPHQAKEEAERFVAFIRDRAGLLNEYGQGRYAFVHKTFQEYLTAEAILNKAEYEDNSELIYEDIRTYLHKAHWREVILLLVGQLQGKKAAKAIEIILRRNSPYERWLHRDLLFAGRCLTEDPEKLAPADPETVSEILKRLIAFETKDPVLIGGRVKEETFEILGWLKETALEIETLANIKLAQNKINQWRFLELQAKLGEKETTLATLLQLLQDPASEVRSRAAEVLGNLGNRSESVVNGLLKLLQDPETSVRYSTTAALVKLGDRSKALVNGLLKLLQDSDAGVRARTKEVFVNLKDLSEAVVNGLFQHLQDSDSMVRSLAVADLLYLGDRSEEVVNDLRQLLQDPKPLVRCRAALALGNLRDQSGEVVNDLLKLLQDPDSGVRSRAASALGNLGDRSEQVINDLLNLLQAPESWVCSMTATALGNLGNHSEVVVNGLLQLLQDPDSMGRPSAAAALGNLGDRSKRVINGLLKLLQDPDWGVRSSAAAALVKLDNRSEAVINGLFKLLQSPARLSAAATLVKLGKSAPEVQSKLALWIEQHSDSPNLGSVIDTLWQICA